MPLFDDTYLTLSQLTKGIRAVVEGAFADELWVTAEVASINRDRKGHCYLQLIEKEGDTTFAKASASIWSSRAAMLEEFSEMTGETLKAGMEVLLRVRVRFHEIYGFSLDIVGINAMFSLGGMARKKRETLLRLEQERLLDRNKALELPLAPQRIAIVSSNTAAGYQDFVHQLANNEFGYVFTHTLFAAQVQGDGAEATIVEALSRAHAQSARFDVVVVIRGGGSVIDLSCFDSYAVAAQIAACPLPVITGIGHERDDTVADIVAHTRCKTPTAVAELLIGRTADFEQRLVDGWTTVSEQAQVMLRARRDAMNTAVYRLHTGVGRYVTAQQRLIETLARSCAVNTKQRIGGSESRLRETAARLRILPVRLITHEQDRVNGSARELTLLTRRTLERASERVHAAERDIEHLDPARVLQRGYSITRFQGKAVRSIQALSEGSTLETQVAHGKILSRVELTEANGEERTQDL